MDESSDALDSAVYAAGLINQIEGETMGLNSMMGQGIIGNSANSLMGGSIANGNSGSVAQLASWNAAQNAAASAGIYKSSYPYKENKPRLDMHLKITQAENGFIVSIANQYGDVLEPHVALTIEDVTTIITSQLASRMLDRVANE